MEKIMLGYIALFVLNVLLSPFLQKKKGVLFCGLFGYSGDSKPNLAKLKILGIKNESRGTHSCGVYYNNRLSKGVGPTREFSDFCEAHIIEDVDTPSQNVFIGHTRFATLGAHTADNAHPFLINENHIFAHNGTIDNIDDLLLKYDISKEENKIEVDSQGLAHLFIQNGKDILEEYRGYAAFLYHDRRDKDALWVFRGASRKYDYVNAQPIDERPLFYAVHKEGIYFSSLEEPLKIIQDGPGQEPISLPTNLLIKVVGSTFAVEAYDIKRENNNIGIDLKKTTVVYPQRTYPNIQHTLPPATATTNRAGQTGQTNSHVGKVLKMFDFESEPQKVDLDITKEAYPPKCFDSRFMSSDVDFVFWWKGRFHYGNDELCHGIMYVNKDGFISDTPQDNYYENYFYEGVLIDGKKLYDSLMFEIETGTPTGIKITQGVGNFAKLLAPYSKYPVTNMITDSVNVPSSEFKNLNLWYMRDNRNKKNLVWTIANHSFTPVYAPDRNYVFREGKLIKIQCAKKDDSPFGLIAGVIKNKPVVSDTTLADNEYLKGLKEAKVNTLAGFFKRKYIDIGEFNAEVPSTVLLALTFYIEDFLMLSEGETSTARIAEVMKNFINQVIADKVSLEDNMIDMQGILEVKEYIKAAIAEEESPKKKQQSDSSFNPIELQKVIDEETTMAKALNVARTMCGMMTKKSNELLGLENPLGKKLAENFSSCSELFRQSLIDCVDETTQKFATTSKPLLRNIIDNEPWKK